MEIVLIDQAKDLTDAWAEHFRGCDDVMVYRGDYFEIPADAMVSPANSYGIMDGGLDEAIRQELGYEVEAAVQEAMGECLPVGLAVTVPTDNPMWPTLIAAPTMHEPGDVSYTDNAYLAFKAVLEHASDLDAERIVCCGLATGVGRMRPDDCAYQMRRAYEEVVN